jgi:heptosyltransferase-3
MNQKEIEKILVIQLRQLGDILLTTPIFRELKRAKPNSHLTFLSHKMGKHIVEGNPYVDLHITYHEKLTFKEEIQLLASIREPHFNYLLDFMFNPKSCLYVLASGADRKISFESSRSILFDQVVQRGGGAYIVDEKFRLLRAMGISPESIKLDMPWGPDQLGPTLELQKLSSAQSRRIRVIIAPTHRRAQRRWPLLKFGDLATRLANEWNSEVIWVWGPGEEQVIDECMSHSKGNTIKAPKTSFRELAALIANSDLFIGNSNGPSHLAVATDTPSLQLHGPTIASSWSPLTSKHHAVQAADQNLSELTVEEVWTELEKMKDIVVEVNEQRNTLDLKQSWIP